MPQLPYQPIPYVKPEYVQDTTSLRQLMQQASMARQQALLQQGQIQGQGRLAIGALIANALDSIQQGRALKAKAAFEQAKLAQEGQEKDRAFALQAAQFQGLQAERAAAQARAAQQDTRIAANEAVENTMPGPIDPGTAATLRAYPGTAPLIGSQTELPARPVSPDMAPMAPPSTFDVRGTTPKEAQQAATLAQAQRNTEAAAARQAATDARLQATLSETQRHNQAMEARPVAGGAAGTTDDAQSIADAIASGQQPPDVTGLYRLAAPVRAALARQGYDLTRAKLDFDATKRHLTTLNGAQQTRLRQAIGTAAESLDVIQNLSDQWKGGRFPILNKANLALARNGAYGKDAASLATQLEGQITDVTSELANAYMGGNSPTDHALQLAAKNLSADWDAKVLGDMIKLAKTNLQIRRNSIEQAGPITATSQAAPVAPATPTPKASGTVIMVAPNGQERPVPADQVDHYKALGAKVKG